MPWPGRRTVKQPTIQRPQDKRFSKDVCRLSCSCSTSTPVPLVDPSNRVEYPLDKLEFPSDYHWPIDQLYPGQSRSNWAHFARFERGDADEKLNEYLEWENPYRVAFAALHFETHGQVDTSKEPKNGLCRWLGAKKPLSQARRRS